MRRVKLLGKGPSERARNLTMLPARFEKIVVIFDTATKKGGGSKQCVNSKNFLPIRFYEKSI